ncbi:unnamed protein product, partial [Meganyctiphanes norvegica]
MTRGEPDNTSRNINSLAAEIPWSNGILERLNGILGTLVAGNDDKIRRALKVNMEKTWGGIRDDSIMYFSCNRERLVQFKAFYFPLKKALMEKISEVNDTQKGKTIKTLDCNPTKRALAMVSRAEVISGGLRVDMTAVPSSTPLYLASWGGHLQVIEKLLKLGANKETATHDGNTPLYAACLEGHLEVIKKLLNAGASKEL